MAITASSVLPNNSLEDFRIEFNNLVTDVDAIQLANTFGVSIIFEGATTDQFETSLGVVDPTADRSILLPNTSGNVLLGTLANPDSADGAALGSASLEWSDLFLADGAVINFGADQDVTLTHVADTGLTLAGTLGVTGKVTGSADVQGTNFIATGDTAAGDLANLGYTSVLGAILTGQGSTNDVTLVNDADVTVMGVATGTTTVNFAGAIVGGSTLAVGYEAAASGSNSSAFGYSALASGTSSTAIGYDMTSSGNHAIGFGYQGIVSGNHSTLLQLDTTNRTLSQANSFSIMGGNVGIGTLTPSTALSVTGALTVTGNSTVGGTLGVTGNTTVGGTLSVTGTVTATPTAILLIKDSSASTLKTINGIAAQ